MKMKTKLTALAVAISAQLLPMGHLAIAQEQNVEEEQEFELIMVTGSFVRRSENFHRLRLLPLLIVWLLMLLVQKALVILLSH